MTMKRQRSNRARAGKGISRFAAAATAAFVGLAITLGAVYALLNASAFNTTAQTVSSGTLKLVLADNGAGFTTAIANLAPTDVVNRYVDVTNSGTLDAKALTLAVADATPTKLTTDLTNGLHATITQCTGGTWTPGTGVCSGTTAALVSGVALKTLATTPSTLIAGAITAVTAVHLQVSITLPDQVETTTNGVLPASTIQGLSASITWTFNETQRTGTTTDS
jgi:spore coat-associated protein N